MSDDNPKTYRSGSNEGGQGVTGGINGGGDFPSVLAPAEIPDGAYNERLARAKMEVAERAAALRRAQIQAATDRGQATRPGKPYPAEPGENLRIRMDPTALDERFRPGEVACEARIIYGAPEWPGGPRDTRIILEQLPSRAIVRLSLILSPTKRSQRIAIDLDPDSWQAMKKVFNGYGNDSIDAPEARKESDEERLNTLIGDLGGLAETNAYAAQLKRWIEEGASRRAEPPGPTPNGRRRFELDDPAPLDGAPTQADARERAIAGIPAGGNIFEAARAQALGRDGYAESGPPNGGGEQPQQDPPNFNPDDGGNEGAALLREDLEF